MSVRPIRTEGVLRAAADQVSYEIELLIYSADELSAWQSSPPSPTGNEANIRLEAFLLHYRNLRGFLCPSLERVRRDDILARDFLDESRGSDVGDARRLGIDRERLNKMLAHLSYSRDGYIQAGDYRWHVRGMLALILGELRGFLARLPQDRSAWFPSAARLEERQWKAEAMTVGDGVDRIEFLSDTVGVTLLRPRI